MNGRVNGGIIRISCWVHSRGALHPGVEVAGNIYPVPQYHITQGFTPVSCPRIVQQHYGSSVNKYPRNFMWTLISRTHGQHHTLTHMVRPSRNYDAGTPGIRENLAEICMLPLLPRYHVLASPFRPHSRLTAYTLITSMAGPVSINS